MDKKNVILNTPMLGFEMIHGRKIDSGQCYFELTELISYKSTELRGPESNGLE